MENFGFNIINVPEVLKNEQQISVGDISFILTRKEGNLDRNRYLHKTFAITFVISGQKEVFANSGQTIVSAGQGILIPQGNVIMTEHASTDGSFERLIILFPSTIIDQFLTRYAIRLNNRHPVENAQPFLHFVSGPLQVEYVKSLKSLISHHARLSAAMALHKLYEILLDLYENNPAVFTSLMMPHADQQTISLKMLVETNLLNHLTLQEMAFLSNRSLSSFKRDFEKEYAMPPQTYIRQRKIELAAAELAKGHHPSELYTLFGYGTLSNFNAAFKRRFGVSPGVYKSLP